MRLPYTRGRAVLLGITAAAIAVSATAGPGYAGEQQARYDGAGTQVIRVGGVTLVDEGSMTCSASTGAGTGGSCLRFDPTNPAPAVLVQDASFGTHVAFQACLDNNGDSVCTSPDQGPCADDIVFSHADGGGFFNPLAVRQGFRPGCPGGPFPGYIIFTCRGTHVDGTAHTHDVTTGTTTLVAGGTGTGNFCGGTQQRQSRKTYTINP
ncbi:MAG: hypothetical protein QOC82_828 [Frankiaceae bacterium]|jgi:hypothetical protein|nr:hypothetical protein [Frankiaceae bacterium]